MLAGTEAKGDREWSLENDNIVIECFEKGTTRPTKGRAKHRHRYPPRYHHAMRAYRRRDGGVTKQKKKEIRAQYKTNGIEHDCWDEWQEIDDKYFEGPDTKSPHQTSQDTDQAAESEEDSEAHLQEEIATLKEEMANMAKSLAKAKKKKNEKKEKYDWGESDDSGSSSSDDESIDSDDSEDEDES